MRVHATRNLPKTLNSAAEQVRVLALGLGLALSDIIPSTSFSGRVAPSMVSMAPS